MVKVFHLIKLWRYRNHKYLKIVAKFNLKFSIPRGDKLSRHEIFKFTCTCIGSSYDYSHIRVRTEKGKLDFPQSRS